MKPIKGIVVELINKKLAYNGVQIEYDFINKSANTKHFTNISIASDYTPSLWCPDRGIVTLSSDPKIKEGDLVILEYFAVVRALGTSIEAFQKHPNNAYEIVDGKVRIIIDTRNTNYIYGIFRKGEFISYNDFCVVEPILEEYNKKIHVMRFDRQTQSLTSVMPTHKCRVLYGENAGKVCVFNPNYLLGEAQKSIVDDKPVYFIQSEYLIAELSESEE